MPAFTLQATAVGGDNAWNGTGAKWDDVSDVNDATYIWTNVNDAKQSFVTQDLPGGAENIVGDVTFHVRQKDAINTADTTNPYWLYGGVREYAAAIDSPAGAFQDYVRTLATFNGGPFSVPIINGGQMGMRRNGNINDIQVAKLYFTGEYSLAAGTFAFLIGSLVGAMLGANLMMADMPGISREVARNPRSGEAVSAIQPHEYEQALRELKSRPFRVYSIPEARR